MIYRLIRKDCDVTLEPSINDENKLHQIKKIKNIYFDGSKVKEVRVRFNRNGIIVVDRIINF